MGNITSNRLGLMLVCALLVSFSAAPPVHAQTWTGNSNGLWNVGSNWSSNPTAPLSSIDTVLNFGAAGIGGTALTQNIANPFLLNTLNFNSNSAAYTIGGNALDFRNGAAGGPAINYNATNNVTLSTPMVLSAPVGIFGGGSGTLTLNGAISGGNGFTVNTFATVVLGSASNTYTGFTTVSGFGPLVLGTGSAIPTGRDVRVFGPGVFSTGGLSNTAATAIGTLSLNDGTFKIPSGSGNYFLSNLQLNGASTGATVDFTGSSSAVLHFVGASAGISASGAANIIGAGTSRIVNDNATPLNITVSSSTSLNIGARMVNGSGGAGFRFAGSGSSGSATLSNPANAATLIIDDNAFVKVADMAFLGSGLVTLSATGASFPGTVNYTGPSASSSKAITLGTGGGGIWVSTTGSNLTLTGVIGEASPGQRLLIAGDGSSVPGATLTLSAVNTYSGPTTIGNGGILSVSTLPNGGTAGPLGSSSAAPANLLIGGGAVGGAGTLRYTGPTAATNRGATLGISSGNSSAIDVANAATTLTITGQLTGNGRLHKSGPGTLTLTNATNNYLGGTIISGGRLSLGAGGALPAGGDVTILPGAEFALGGGSNTAATALGLVELGSGNLRSSSGATNLYVSGINAYGGSVDYSGSDTSSLRLVNSGGVRVALNTTWTPNGASAGSRLISETGTAGLEVSPGVTWTNGFSLFSGSFQLTGGGTLYQLSPVTSNLTVAGARYRIDNLANLPPSGNGFFFDGGTFEYSGPTAAFNRFVSVSEKGIDFAISNPATTLTYTGSIVDIFGNGPLVKSGPGTLLLNSGSNTYAGGITVANGRLEVPGDAYLGTANPTINALGTLRYNLESTTARIFNLQGGSLEAAPGATLTLNGATVGGGFIRGAGNITLAGGTLLAGTTIAVGTSINQSGAATVTNFINNGSFQNAAGRTLTWNGGTNTSAGSLFIYGTANATGMLSDGTLGIYDSGTLNNSGTPLYLGGGSTTYVGTPPGSATASINLGGQPLELRAGLLSNNGTISNGIVNVRYGGLAKGAGTYPAVFVDDGGKFSPGNSPGTVTTASTTWGSGGGYLFEINDAAGVAGTNWDLWNINGGLSITAGTTTNSRFTISIASLDASNASGNAANFSSANNYSWLIASTTAGITGFDTARFTLDTSAFTNPIGGGSFALSQVGNNLFLNFNGVSTPPQWNVDANGSWSTAANWLPPSVPNSPTATANFLGKITAPRTVTLDGNKTVGAIYFDNSNTYTIAPGSGGTLSVVGGVDPNGFNIQAFNGNHTISAPLAIAAGMGMTARPGASLTLSGPFSIAAGIELNANGVITISGPQNHGANAVFNAEGVGLITFASNAGTPATAGSAAIHNLFLSVGHNGSVTFTANQDLLDLGIDTSEPPEHIDLASPAAAGAFRAIRIYSTDLPASKASLYASIANANKAGAPDPTDGIFDSGRGLHPNSGIGLALVNDAHGDPNVFIRLTRIGDLNLDGTVSISDFIDLASHFNGPGTWQEGDLNYDNQVTISDFIDLASNFNTSYAGESWPISAAEARILYEFAILHQTSVPEPAIFSLLIMTGLVLTRRRGGFYVGK